MARITVIKEFKIGSIYFFNCYDDYIPKDEDIPFYERIRYGLEVPDEKIKNIIL